MYRYLSLPCRLLRHHSRAFAVLQHHGFSTKAKSESDIKIYDLSTYEFQYSPEEKNMILTALNQSSEEELSHFKITKGYAKKLIKSRLQIGSFQDISQLLDIDGFGIKSVERICKKVLNNPPTCTSEVEEEESKEPFSIYRWVKPEIEPDVLQNLQTILAIDITVGVLSWTLLDRHGKVLDFSTQEVLSKSTRFDSPKLYDKMVYIVENLPMADAYVWEEKANYGHLQRAPLSSIMIAIKLAQMRGILTALLNVREGEEENRRLFYLREALVSKLFNLKIGGERISGLSLADNIMKGEKVLYWLPPLVLDKETQNKYNNIQRKPLFSSLFVGLAFQQTIVENNLDAYKILNEKQ